MLDATLLLVVFVSQDRLKDYHFVLTACEHFLGMLILLPSSSFHLDEILRRLDKKLGLFGFELVHRHHSLNRPHRLLLEQEHDVVLVLPIVHLLN